MKRSTFSAQVANNLLTVLQGYSKTIRLLLVMFLTLTVTTNAWADYTIAFKSTDGADGSTAQTTIANLISSGGTNVSTISATRAYNGKSGYGIKLGSSSSTGNVNMTLANSAQIKASKLVVKAAYYDSNKTLKVTVTYTDNTTTTQTITPASSLTDYDVSLTDTKTIKQIKIESVTASKGRMYCHSIKVVAASAAVTTYTVTYDLNGGTGTTPTQANVAAGGTFTLAASSGFSNAGYSFAGWNDGTTTYNAGATYIMPAKAVTLKAQWTVLPKYTVTLNAGPGTCAASVTETSAGAGVTLPTPTLDCGDWEFAGWKTTSAVTTETTTEPTLIAAGTYSPTSDITLYAVYQRTETTSGGGGTENKTYAHSITSKTWSANGAQTLNSISWTLNNNGSYYGYDATKGQQIGSGSSPAKSMTLTTSGFASATKITAVRISTSGASSISGTVSVKVGSTAYTSGGSTTKSLTTTNTEYEFTGSSTGNVTITWTQTSSKAIYFKTIEVDYQTTTAGGGSTTYYHSTPDCGSTPDPIGYTITYNTNGGDAIAATSGTALPNPLPTPTRQHYTFVGWYTDESCTQAATAGATIDADITLYAKWTPKVYLTILHPQDGVLLDTNGTQQDSIIIEYVYGTSAVDIPVANYYQSITRDGYKFKGWYNATSGGSKWLNIAQGKNQNLWAQWLEERTVTYYSIGQVYDTQTYGNGETLTLPTTAPTACDGYTFVGWTTAEQSETTTKPTLVSNTTVVSSDMILYAVYSLTEAGGGSSNYELTNIEDIAEDDIVVITMTYTEDGTIYALSSSNGSSDTPPASIVTVSDSKLSAEPADELKWNISNSSGILTIYPNGTIEKWLYCTSSNDGVRVGTNTNKNFTIDASSGYLKNIATSRYVGVYRTTPDWRCYTNTTGNTANQILQFYKKSGGSTTTYTTSPNCCPVNLEKPQVTYSVADGAVTLNWTMVNNESDVADYTVACVGGEIHTTTATSYTFTGLTNCAEYTFTVKANGDGTDVCSSGVTAVTATPAAGSFTVTFDYGAGEGTPTQWTSGCANGTSTTLPTPTTLPDNHTFEGWYDGTNLYVAGDNYTPTSDVILYARYTRNTAVDIVEWDPDAITIEVNTEGSAQVQIENQTTHGSSSNIADNLFFSKYYESTNNVKLLAVFNGTGNDVDLSDFRIRLSGAGKTICSGTTSWSSTITLSGTLEQGKEYILYEDGNNDTDEAVMACVQENHADELATWNLNTSVSFSGNDAVILEQNNGSSYEIIDIIGAGTNSAANLGSTCDDGVVDAVDFMDAKGWYNADGESIEDGSTIALSTNRCLLVRKSTVKSGAIAVAKNITDFVTLGGEFGEWIGKQIPDGSDEGVQASCDGFDFVGTFNYGGYYQTYDSLTRIDLGGNQNADGTYTIPVPELDTLSCTKMRIQVLDNNGASLASSEYKVPIMVKSSGVTTTDELFSKHGIEGCRDCDVVILKNATLQKASDGTANDMPEVRDMEVYAGGKLVVPNGTNYTMRKLVMRSKGDEVPVAEIDGTAVISDKLYHAKRIDAQKFYFFTLPYDCAVSDITYYNGEVLGARGIDYVIKYYDGAGRANGQNAGHWEEFTGATLQAGIGYILAVDASLNGDFNDNPKKEFLFPMTKTLTENSDKTVAVGTWGIGDATIGDNHKGWNLIGTPFMSHYNPISATGLKVGTYTDGEWNSEGTIFTYNESVTVPYVTMPNADGKTYTQRLASSQDLEPFKSFFIQVGKEGDVITDVAFSSAERLSKAPHRAPAVDATVWVELELKNTSGSDFTTIILDENCTADYEIGADLEKMLGYAALPQFYSLQSNARLAFNALPSEFASVSIPLGFYAPKSDTYTIALNTENTQNLEGVYLTDNVAGTVTNLLLDDYTFSSAKVLNETRFSIAVVRAVTAVDNVLAENDFVSIVNSYDLHIKNAPIGSELRVYDTLGREVISDQIDVEQKIYHLRTAGVYHVQIISKDKKSVYKVVSY